MKTSQLCIFDKQPLGGFSKNTPLHIAADDGQLEICKFIIENATAENGVQKNPKNGFGEIPLHLAAQSGHLEICKFLLDYTDDPSEENHMGETPLYLAIKGKHKKIYKLLRRYTNKFLRRCTRISNHAHKRQWLW